MPGAAPDIMRDYDLATLGYEEIEYSFESTADFVRVAGRARCRRPLGRDPRAPGSPRDPVRGAQLGRRIRCGSAGPSSWSGTTSRPVSTPRRTGASFIAPWPQRVTPGSASRRRRSASTGPASSRASTSSSWRRSATRISNTLATPGPSTSSRRSARCCSCRADENPLVGLSVTQILAAGESQSAACLVTYINALDPHAQLFDGFFVHGRPASGVSIDGVFIPSSTARSACRSTRGHLRQEAKRIRGRTPWNWSCNTQSETDVILLGGGLAAQPDSDRLRTWEMAGAAHADTYTVSAWMSRRRHADRRADGRALAPHEAT